MSRVVTGSSDGPYVLVEVDDVGVTFLRRCVALLAGDRELGLIGLVSMTAPGIAVRCASRLRADDVDGWQVRCDPPRNDETRWLPGCRVTRVNVSATTVWFYLVDGSDPDHLPEIVRSDSIELRDLGV